MPSLLGKTRRIGPPDIDGVASAALLTLQIQGDTGKRHEATVSSLYSEGKLASLEWGQALRGSADNETNPLPTPQQTAASGRRFCSGRIPLRLLEARGNW
jgi:hypothetical protein